MNLKTIYFLIIILILSCEESTEKSELDLYSYEPLRIEFINALINYTGNLDDLKYLNKRIFPKQFGSYYNFGSELMHSGQHQIFDYKRYYSKDSEMNKELIQLHFWKNEPIFYKRSSKIAKYDFQSPRFGGLKYSADTNLTEFYKTNALINGFIDITNSDVQNSNIGDHTFVYKDSIEINTYIKCDECRFEMYYNKLK